MSTTMEDIQHKVRNVMEEVKKRDPTGYSKAETTGDLMNFVSEDLKKAGVDIDKASDYVKQGMKDAGGRAGSILNGFSQILDFMFFDPFYRMFTSKNEFQLATEVSKTSYAKNADLRLLPFKLIFAVLASSCIAFSFLNAQTGNIYHSVGAGIISLDLVRMSYNCYVKNYFSIAGRKLGGDLNRVVDTLANIGKSAGDDAKQNPLVRLKKGIKWEVIPHNTITQFLLSPIGLLFRGREQEVSS